MAREDDTGGSYKGEEFTGERGHRRLPQICTYERELPVKVERLYENEHPAIFAQIQFRPKRGACHRIRPDFLLGSSRRSTTGALWIYIQ